MTGYESVGTVIERGAAVRALALGDRVVAFYGHRALGARRATAPDAPGWPEDYAAGCECSARDAAFAFLQAHLRVGGRICVLADGNREPLQLAPSFHARELLVVGSSDGWDYAQHAHWYFACVRAGSPALEAIFDESVTAAELPATFARLARGAVTPVKVLVRYGE
jgi:alcohol dehydrogenase